ncbi:exosortase A system-associated hydrolase 1 [Novosphingobium sp. CF614]|uniref:hydrolase 1, exosortase A system-associated n=1 Tax=Novosphingobium sp. CF614 TaxID=1884364 RepID=UPI0008E1E735|nr:hydrolase 1, exosortase A system-associated [Novosphingobium sp. CF614]SFG27877.1 exosortase A system-associated hydrolase 1 [Novosphingobium sp. CF614]
MSRRHFTFACAGCQLVATLDEAGAETGLLLVSGGNEVRAGAWNGQARLAARIAAEGYPVLRFDRRGVGDSEGANGEFRSSGADIAAALAAFRRQCPHVTRVVGFGNCNAASALMLTGGAGFAALILSNPWTIEDNGEAPPAAVVRDHYRRRLANPAAIGRLLTGKVSIGKLARGLAAAIRPARQARGGLAAEIERGLAGFHGPVRFLIAGRDRTGIAFLSKWPKTDPRIRTCAEATHSYVEPEAQEWLAREVLEILRG